MRRMVVCNTSATCTYTNEGFCTLLLRSRYMPGPLKKEP